MPDLDSPRLRPVVWMGDALKKVRAFPVPVRKLIGDELQLIQFGQTPAKTKPFRGVDSGVLEIVIRHDKEAYRSVVAVQLGETIYVLHAFQKKSKSGIKTPTSDVDLIKRRYQQAKELASHAR